MSLVLSRTRRFPHICRSTRGGAMTLSVLGHHLGQFNCFLESFQRTVRGSTGNSSLSCSLFGLRFTVSRLCRRYTCSRRMLVHSLVRRIKRGNRICLSRGFRLRGKVGGVCGGVRQCVLRTELTTVHYLSGSYLEGSPIV